MLYVCFGYLINMIFFLFSEPSRLNFLLMPNIACSQFMYNFNCSKKIIKLAKTWQRVISVKAAEEMNFASLGPCAIYMIPVVLFLCPLLHCFFGALKLFIIKINIFDFKLILFIAYTFFYKNH